MREIGQEKRNRERRGTRRIRMRRKGGMGRIERRKIDMGSVLNTTSRTPEDECKWFFNPK
jgi:hypothetical protein